MKKRSIFCLILCFWMTLLSAQTIENPPIYQQVRLKTTAPDILGQLMALGLPADHVHKHDNRLELILSEAEVAVLDQEAIPYEITIPDMRAHYLVRLTSVPSDNSMDCGLTNF
ncbi:MAG: hypothetical protein AAF985_13655, partial [Bacteroidota bacterium]